MVITSRASFPGRPLLSNQGLILLIYLTDKEVILSPKCFLHQPLLLLMRQRGREGMTRIVHLLRRSILAPLKFKRWNKLALKTLVSVISAKESVAIKSSSLWEMIISLKTTMPHKRKETTSLVRIVMIRWWIVSSVLLDQTVTRILTDEQAWRTLSSCMWRLPAAFLTDCCLSLLFSYSDQVRLGCFFTLKFHQRGINGRSFLSLVSTLINLKQSLSLYI